MIMTMQSYNGENNILATKSFAFALSALNIFNELKENKHFTLANQFIRSATSIGANIEESIGAHSQKDFLAKLIIAYKEPRETKYWLRLFIAGHLIVSADAELDMLEQIIRMLGASIKTTRTKLNAPNML